MMRGEPVNAQGNNNPFRDEAAIAKFGVEKHGRLNAALVEVTGFMQKSKSSRR